MAINDPAQVQAHYAADHDLRTRQETHRLYTVGPGLETSVDQTLALLGNEDLLDVGTGPGDYPGRLRQEGHQGRLVGVDVVAGMVERATAAHPGVEFVLADAQALPFADQSFDVVSARHMLYHVPDIAKALAECWRVLKAGGKFLAITNADDYMQGFWEAVWEALEGEEGFEAVMAERNANKYLHNRLVTMVFETFSNAELKIVEAALEFPSAEPAIRYFNTMQSYYGINKAIWDRGAEKVKQVFSGRVKDGVWRVEKPVALITAAKI